MKKVFIILTLCVFLAFLVLNAQAIERVPKKGTAASKAQKEETRPVPAVPEKKETSLSERQTVKPGPLPGPEHPRDVEIKNPQKEREQGISRIPRGLGKGIKEEGKDKYDYFIDKNGNGIDDRLEQQVKNEKPPEKTKKPEERKPPAEKKERLGR